MESYTCKNCESHLTQLLKHTGYQRDGYVKIPNLYYCEKCDKVWRRKISWEEEA